jgi:hypothetical protein
MPTSDLTCTPGAPLSGPTLLAWRIAQTLVWLIGALILVALFLWPNLGLLLFWNILIPVAPLLFVLVPGIWRNVCPLATTVLLPRHFGLSKRKTLSFRTLGQLNLLGVLTFYAIVPLRHAVFNCHGEATGLLLVALGALGLAMGFRYEWKSAWCSGLCPVHPVEKLYGAKALWTTANAHCDRCMNCVIPCPDSTPNMHPGASKKTIYHRWSGVLVSGGLPGFIWGWFQVPDQTRLTFSAWAQVYAWPLMGLGVTLAIYVAGMRLIHAGLQRPWLHIFAATGVSCYYWYRIPALLGFGKFGASGRLVDLSQSLPGWTVWVIPILSSLFFFYWLVFRPSQNLSWVRRPPFGARGERKG